MILALQKIISPKEWEHDKLLTNNKNETVAEILSKNGIIPT